MRRPFVRFLFIECSRLEKHLRQVVARNHTVRCKSQDSAGGIGIILRAVLMLNVRVFRPLSYSHTCADPARGILGFTVITPQAVINTMVLQNPQNHASYFELQNHAPHKNHTNN